jgi:hypothetical protein
MYQYIKLYNAWKTKNITVRSINTCYTFSSYAKENRASMTGWILGLKMCKIYFLIVIKLHYKINSEKKGNV